MLSNSVSATEITPDTINWLNMAKGMFGGLALFLFGMEQMSNALKSALGDQMKVLLAKLTRNRFTAALTGAFVTAVIQSSSVTTVLVVGFVSAGMMTLTQTVGVIMGANVGTTITAQIVAFKVEELALWMIAIGFFMLFISKHEKLKYYGSMIMGLGLIFFGMSLMGEGMTPLRSYAPFLELMSQMDNVFFGVLVGALFTALVQSSSATTAIVITMAAQGLISLEAGIALSLGANIGTCVTAQLAALGKSRNALRAAMVHLLFNVIGVLIWLPFVSLLASWVIGFSPTHPELEGIARMGAEIPRQIANAHTIFNVANLLILIPFTVVFAKLAEHFIPVRKEQDKGVIIRPKFLDDHLLTTPTMALQAVRLEAARMGEIIQKMLTMLSVGILVEKSRTKLLEVQKTGRKIDVLQGEIFRYLGAIRKQPLSKKESAEVAVGIKMVSEFESIGNVIETDLVGLGYQKLEDNIQSSDVMQHLFNKLGKKITQVLEATIRAAKEKDQLAADEVLLAKADINQLIKQALSIQSESLADMTPEQIEIIRMEITALENLKRIYTHLKRIAKEFVPQETRVVD
ncbi:MAG: Na/Pi cotransporter family protein [Proteobacteria bacterium]|nr:Na/Pi cotransporter family protein [Pseudomonadota bacterium]